MLSIVCMSFLHSGFKIKTSWRSDHRCDQLQNKKIFQRHQSVQCLQILGSFLKVRAEKYFQDALRVKKAKKGQKQELNPVLHSFYLQRGFLLKPLFVLYPDDTSASLTPHPVSCIHFKVLPLQSFSSFSC